VKLRVEDYLLLDESGAFDAYRKTELIEGKCISGMRSTGRTRSPRLSYMTHFATCCGRWRRRCAP